MTDVAGTTGRTGFTGELWHSIEDVYARILHHPFHAGLTDGTLPEENFRFYVLQDTQTDLLVTLLRL